MDADSMIKQCVSVLAVGLMVFSGMYILKDIVDGFGNPIPRSPGDNVMGLWHFDESSGSTAYDSSDYSNDATIYGATVGVTANNPASGDFAKCLEFDGTNDYATVPNDATLVCGRDSLTVEAWIYPDTIVGYDRIVTKKWQYYLNLESGYLAWSISGGSPAGYLYSTAALPTGQWTHVAGTWDGSVSRIYINGVLNKYMAVTGTMNNYYYPVYIGNSQDESRYFDGKIDEVCITDYAKYKTNLCGSWNFDETHGVPIKTYDGSRRGYDGTLSSSPALVAGKFGNCLSFDGSDDYVQCGDMTDFEFTGDFTVSAWFKKDTNSNNQLMVSKWTGAGSGSQWWLGFYNDKLAFGLYQGSVTIIYSTKTTNELYGNWHHVACVRTGSTLKIYIDGALDNSGSVSTSTAGSNTAPLCIGSYNTGSGWFFDGSIDEVRIHNIVLTANQIRNHGLGIYTESDYQFNDGTGPTINDYSEFDNDASIKGGFTGCVNFGGSAVSSLALTKTEITMLSTVNDNYNGWGIKFNKTGTGYTKTITDYSYSSGTGTIYFDSFTPSSGEYIFTVYYGANYGPSWAAQTKMTFDGYDDFAVFNPVVLPQRSFTHNLVFCREEFPAPSIPQRDKQYILQSDLYEIYLEVPAKDANGPPTTNDEARLSFKMYYGSTSSNNFVVSTGYMLKTQWWYNLTIVYDMQTVKIYLNYKLEGSHTIGVGETATSPKISFSTPFLCSDWDMVYPFKGKIDNYTVCSVAKAMSNVVDSTTDVDISQDGKYLLSRLDELNGAPLILYHFNEGSGTTITDYGLADLDGTISGTGAWVDGKRNGGYLLKNNAYISVQGDVNNLLEFTDQMGIEAWIRPATITANAGIISKENSYLLQFSSSSGYLRGGLYINSAWTYVTDDTTPIKVGEWTHIAFTYGGSSMKLYVNGINVKSASASGSIETNSNNLYLGRYSNNYFNGIIDEVRLNWAVISDYGYLNYYHTEGSIRTQAYTLSSGYLWDVLKVNIDETSTTDDIRVSILDNSNNVLTGYDKIQGRYNLFGDNKYIINLRKITSTTIKVMFNFNDESVNSPKVLNYEIFTQSDTDSDGMGQSWETQYSATNPATDGDSDGLTNLNEWKHLLNPNDADSDDDNLKDGREVNIGGRTTLVVTEFDGGPTITHDFDSAGDWVFYIPIPNYTDAVMIPIETTFQITGSLRNGQYPDITIDFGDDEDVDWESEGPVIGSETLTDDDTLASSELQDYIYDYTGLTINVPLRVHSNSAGTLSFSNFNHKQEACFLDANCQTISLKIINVKFFNTKFNAESWINGMSVTSLDLTMKNRYTGEIIGMSSMSNGASLVQSDKYSQVSDDDEATLYVDADLVAAITYWSHAELDLPVTGLTGNPGLIITPPVGKINIGIYLDVPISNAGGSKYIVDLGSSSIIIGDKNSVTYNPIYPTSSRISGSDALCDNFDYGFSIEHKIDCRANSLGVGRWVCWHHMMYDMYWHTDGSTGGPNNDGNGNNDGNLYPYWWEGAKIIEGCNVQDLGGDDALIDDEDDYDTDGLTEDWSEYSDINANDHSWHLNNYNQQVDGERHASAWNDNKIMNEDDDPAIAFNEIAYQADGLEADGKTTVGYDFYLQYNALNILWDIEDEDYCPDHGHDFAHSYIDIAGYEVASYIYFDVTEN